MKHQATTPESLTIWARDARPGDKHVYYVGYLASSKTTAKLADVAYSLQRDGLVNLLQRRLGPDNYEYIAQRRDDSKPLPGPIRVNVARPLGRPAEPLRSTPEPRRPNLAEDRGDRILQVMAAGLARDLEETRARLARLTPGSPIHARLQQFARECEGALRSLDAELPRP